MEVLSKGDDEFQDFGADDRDALLRITDDRRPDRLQKFIAREFGEECGSELEIDNALAEVCALCVGGREVAEEVRKFHAFQSRIDEELVEGNGAAAEGLWVQRDRFLDDAQEAAEHGSKAVLRETLKC